MSDRLVPYGSTDTRTMVKMGKDKTPAPLVARMPSADVAAKVGSGVTNAVARGCRVVRRNAQD